jgi:hypothetical protein
MKLSLAPVASKTNPDGKKTLTNVLSSPTAMSALSQASSPSAFRRGEVS